MQTMVKDMSEQKLGVTPPGRDPRRARNIRTGLWLAALALFFFLLVIFKHKVLGA